MGRNYVNKERKNDIDKKIKWIKKFIKIAQKNGLKSLNMNEVAKGLNVSKATIYNHFKSKEELVYFMVVHLLNRLSYFKVYLMDDSKSYTERYYLAFNYMISKMLIFNQIIVDDIREFYPKEHRLLENYKNELRSSLEEFFNEGIKKGIIDAYNPLIVAAADVNFLELLRDEEFMASNDLSSSELANQHFEFRMKGILKADKREERIPQIASMLKAV